jgi:hypothetical protein
MSQGRLPLTDQQSTIKKSVSYARSALKQPAASGDGLPAFAALVSAARAGCGRRREDAALVALLYASVEAWGSPLPTSDQLLLDDLGEGVRSLGLALEGAEASLAERRREQQQQQQQREAEGVAH